VEPTPKPPLLEYETPKEMISIGQLAEIALIVLLLSLPLILPWMIVRLR
jgi:hypothetical protein